MGRSMVLILSVVLLASAGSACGTSNADDKHGRKAARTPQPTPTQRKVIVFVDQKKRAETMTAATAVRDVLAQVGVRLGPHDLVTPPADAAPAPEIKVLRLLSAPVTRVVKIPAPTVEKKSGKLPAFSRKVLRKGRPGLKKVQTAYVRRRGEKVKAVIAQHVQRRPVARIVAVGPRPSGVGSAARLNWAALAKCESGGNPRAVNPAGYYGLYQFNRQSWASVGGSGLPSDASAAEQTYRAQLLYKKVNGRWQGQWPHCGSRLFS